MKIAFNPSTVAALTSPPNNKDITFDLKGHNIFARGVEFKGTDTNTWRPVVDNLISDSTTSSLSAKQGKVLKALIDGKSNSGHTHDDRYLKLTGGVLTGNLIGTSATFSGRFHNAGDDEGIIINPAANGYAGLILGTYNGERSVFYFTKGNPFWRYNNGTNNLDIKHPKKAGTIALTSDIPNKGSWNYDDRYLKLSGGTMNSDALIIFADSGSWSTDKGPQGARGGLYWSGQSDYAKLYAEETAADNLDLVIQFGDDNSNGLSIRNKVNTQTSYISAGGVITTGIFKGNLDWSYITNKPATATRWPSWEEVTGKPNSFTPSTHTHGLSNSVFFLNMPSISGNAKWKEVFGYPVNYNLLLSVRINSPAPEWCVGNYGSGILYGGSDTKGFMSSAYNEPLIMWAGGNGSSDDSVPKWYIGIRGTHKSIYNLTTIASEANAAYNLRHSHANKSVLDGITSGLVSNWNTAYTFVHTITGTDTDKVINKWDEIVNFLAGITEDNKLNTLLNSKLSVYELADKTNVGIIKNNGIYYSTTDASSGTLTNSPFNTGFALINMTSYDVGDDLRRSRLAFNAYGEIKVSDDRGQANTAETWYNVLTSKNSGISGSTIKLNGTSITVYSSGTADGRYVKKSGDTMTGALNFANGTWNLVGDDSYMGDCNVSGHFGIKAANTTYPGIAFFNNANAHLGSLTAYSGNIKYGAYSLQFLDNGNTSVGASTWTNPFSAYDKDAVKDGQAICVWGQSSRLSNLASDSGDMSLWLKRVNAKAATLNMVLDGEYYANGSQRLAHISEIPSSLKNPYALTISLNGTSQGPYDGSAAKSINITPGSIGAATSGHNHDGRYVYNYGGTQMDGASRNKNALGMSTTSGISGDWWHILQAAWNDEYRWNSQIAFPTQNRNGMYYRSGLDDNTKWGAWIKLLDTGNSYVTNGKGVINGTTITQVDNADKLDGIHANGLLTALSNANKGISITVGGTTKSLSNISVSHADTVGQSWNVSIQGQHWSRLYVGNPAALHHSSIFSIRGSIGCVVFCQTFLVEANHSGSATIICLFSGSYTQPKMRTLVKSDGTVLVDLYWSGSDCSQSSSTQQMTISVTANVLQGSISPTTSLTNDDTIPSGYSNTCEFQCTSKTSNFYDVTLNTLQANSIKNLSIGGGIYWNPHVESATDGSDAASITVVKAGVAGGTTLVLSQQNDANDTIQFKTSTAARLYHNSNQILTSGDTKVSSGKGYINNTEITQVNNATNATKANRIVNWYSARPTSLNAQFGDGSLRIFHATSTTTEGKSPNDATVLHLAWDNNGGWDSQLAINSPSGRVYSRSQNGGTWQPWKTLAFTTDIPTTLKNPAALTTFGVVYDGSAAKVVNPSNFISQVNEATATITDGTMFITSYASNSGFADTNAVNVPYKRKALHLWEYIKAKTDSLYATKSHNHDNKYLKWLGNAGQSNMNAIGRISHSSGMTTLADPGNTTDNPMEGGSKSTSWHLYWQTNYTDDPSGSNAWVAQIVNRAGTDRWWVRSRNGGTITNGTGWASNWRFLVTAPTSGLGNGNQPIYINSAGEVVAANSYPTSLRSPHALTLKANGTTLATYDGSSAKEANFTYANVGAASASHTHDDRYVRKWIGVYGSANKFLKLAINGEKGWIRLEVSDSNNGLTGGYGIYIIGWSWHGQDNADTLTVKCLYANASQYITALKVVRTSRNNYDFYFQFASGSSCPSYTINYSSTINSIDCTVTAITTIPTATWVSSLSALQLNASQVDWSGIQNKPSTFNPAAHTHTWTSITDKIVAGNEFNIVSAGFKESMWFNYLPINDRNKTAAVASYIMGNGAKGYASVQASGFIKHGSNSSYVLLGDGGHAAISQLSVKYATSAGSATSATKVIVNQHTSNDINYPLVWSNQSNTSSVTENQLYKSWADLYYNPKNKRLTVGGSFEGPYGRFNNQNGGVIVGDSTNARISAIGNQLIFNTGGALRFGDLDWDYSKWAGLKYNYLTKTIYLGIADGSIFTTYEGAQSEGTLNLRANISYIDLNSGTSIRGLSTNGSPYHSTITLKDTSMSLSTYGDMTMSTGPGTMQLSASNAFRVNANDMRFTCKGGFIECSQTGSNEYTWVFNNNIKTTGQIVREGSSQSWVNGRKGALLRETSVSGYHALWSLKTTNGSWDFGEYNARSDWNNIPVLTYITDTNFNSGNNTPTYQIKFPLASGTVALTSNILNPTDYYWANIKVSASSNTQTKPSVNTIYANNWFRSQGATGWYNESYGGGLHMTDTTWIRTFGNKSFYCNKQIYSSDSIRMGDVYLEHTNEINSASGLHLNYQNSGNVTLCKGGGAVIIGHTPDNIGNNKLYVNGPTTLNSVATFNGLVTNNGGILPASYDVNKNNTACYVWGDAMSTGVTAITDALDPKYVSVHHSQNNGSSWSDMGMTNQNKFSLYANNGSKESIYLGANNTTGGISQIQKNQLMVTFEIPDNLYSQLCWASIDINNGVQTVCTVEIIAKDGTIKNTFTKNLYGWNNLNYMNFWGNNSAVVSIGQDSARFVRFKFKHDAGNTYVRNALIHKIRIFSYTKHALDGGDFRSIMANTGHLYKYDANLNTTFPNAINCTTLNVGKFIINGSDINNTSPTGISFKQNGTTIMSYYSEAVNINKKLNAYDAVFAGRVSLFSIHPLGTESSTDTRSVLIGDIANYKFAFKRGTDGQLLFMKWGASISITSVGCTIFGKDKLHTPTTISGDGKSRIFIYQERTMAWYEFYCA